jgi:hypothetical protein
MIPAAFKNVESTSEHHTYSVYHNFENVSLKGELQIEQIRSPKYPPYRCLMRTSTEGIIDLMPHQKVIARFSRSTVETFVQSAVRLSISQYE